MLIFSIFKTPLLSLFFLYSISAYSELSADNFSIRLASHNLNRFFDDRDDGDNEKILTTKHYQKRLNQLVEKVDKTYPFADVIAFQEVENINILKDASHLIAQRFKKHYRAILIEGNDKSGMDVGFLVKQSIPVKSTDALFKDRYINPQKNLFSRPPLVIEICPNSCLTIINLHLRSMRGLRSNKSSDYVAGKRVAQAEAIAQWVERYQREHPNKKLIILGDLNALTPSDEYVDVIGTIIGNPDQKTPLYKSKDLISRDLIDITLNIESSKRYSYLYKKKKQQLDYALVSQGLKKHIKSIGFSWIDYKFSDHAALIIDLGD